MAVAEIISYVARLYCFPLSLRHVDELLAVCDIAVSHGQVAEWIYKRQWRSLKSGQISANLGPAKPGGWHKLPATASVVRNSGK